MVAEVGAVRKGTAIVGAIIALGAGRQAWAASVDGGEQAAFPAAATSAAADVTGTGSEALAAEPIEPSETVAAEYVGPTLFSAAWTGVLGGDLAAEDPAQDVLALRNRLDLEVHHPVRAGLSVRLAARLVHRAQVGHDGAVYRPAFRATGPDLGMRYDFDGQLRQAWLQSQTAVGRLTVGREIANWGVLELQSPLRFLHPIDLSQGLIGSLSDAEVSPLVPSWMVRLQRELGPGQLDIVGLPFFEQHRYSPFATDAAMVRPGVGPELSGTLGALLRRLDLRLDRQLSEALMTALRPPSATPLDGSLAARWQVHLASMEVAVVAAWAWDRLPELHLDADLLMLLGRTLESGFDTSKLAANFADPAFVAATERAKGKSLTDLATARWHRRAIVGVEWQAEVGQGWMAKAELAWSHHRVLMTTQLQPLGSPLVQTGFGLEKTWGDWLTVLAEANWQFAYEVPRGQPLLLAARNQWQVGGGLLARLGDGQAWVAQLGGFYGISLQDWAIAPRLSWEFAEHWRTALGAVVADGPANSPAGFFGNDDQVLLELRRTF